MTRTNAAHPQATRRTALRHFGALAAVAAAPTIGACTPRTSDMPAFATPADALRTLQALKTAPPKTTGAWDLAQVLHHAAQSVEYSLAGFPQLKPAWFRSTVGPLAFAMFSARGRMSHGLAEPIPGAPVIAAGQALDAAVDRLVAALRAFDAHTGALAPHFAYGALDKKAFERAHLMHLANHWDEVASA
jgi:hypothetical protein